MSRPEASAGEVDRRPSACETAHHCITCADEGVPMTVLAVDARRGLALCADAEDAHSTVETALIDSVKPGDTLLVHAATAIAALPSEAAQALNVGTR